MVPQVNPAFLNRVARGRRHHVEVPEGITGMLRGREGDEGLKDADAVVRGQVNRAHNKWVVRARSAHGNLVATARNQATLGEDVVPSRDKDPHPTLGASFGARAPRRRTEPPCTKGPRPGVTVGFSPVRFLDRHDAASQESIDQESPLASTRLCVPAAQAAEIPRAQLGAIGGAGGKKPGNLTEGEVPAESAPGGPGGGVGAMDREPKGPRGTEGGRREAMLPQGSTERAAGGGDRA